METSDIAAAALQPDRKGKCGCSRTTKNLKPSPKCPKCKGKGIVEACETCGGSGWNPRTNHLCNFCNGNGYRMPTI